MEEVANNPDETAEHQPENDAAGDLQFLPQRSDSQRADGEDGHHAQFAERKESYKRKWIHPGQVGLAVGDVHGAPKDSGTKCGPDAMQGMRRGAASRRCDSEQRRTGAHDERAAQNAGELPPTGLTQLIEEKEAPKNAEQAVRVPERKGNAQTDVANRIDRQRVRHGPEASGK